MKTVIDFDNWARKGHYDFFRDFDEPFFGITAEVDCTKAYEAARATNSSFFLSYLHKSLLAVHQTDSFRYRIEDEKVYLYDEIKASATIGRDDGTFGFSYIPFFKDYSLFEQSANAEIERVKKSRSVDPSSANDVIHYSSIPWIRFTAITHARKYSRPESVPKISFGKLAGGKKKTMPVSIFAHHALMDGYHVAEYLDLFQKLLSTDP